MTQEAVSRSGCVFCGSLTNKMSREHLHRSAFASSVNTPFKEIVRTKYTPGRDDRQVINIPRGPFDLPVGGVCKVCNESWLNDIDAEAEPIVVSLGEHRRSWIRRDEIAPLARWATRTALVLTLMDQSRGGAAPGSLFANFYETRMPPLRVVIRVGTGPMHLKAGGSNHWAVVDRDGVIADHADSAGGAVHVVSWGLGHFFTHVVMTDYQQVVGQVRHLQHRISDEGGQQLKLLWPHQRRAIRLDEPLEAETAARVGSLSYLLLDQPLDKSDFG